MVLSSFSLSLSLSISLINNSDHNHSTLNYSYYKLQTSLTLGSEALGLCRSARGWRRFSASDRGARLHLLFSLLSLFSHFCLRDPRPILSVSVLHYCRNHAYQRRVVGIVVRGVNPDKIVTICERKTYETYPKLPYQPKQTTTTYLPLPQQSPSPRPRPRSPDEEKTSFRVLMN